MIRRTMFLLSFLCVSLGASPFLLAQHPGEIFGQMMGQMNLIYFENMTVKLTEKGDQVVLNYTLLTPSWKQFQMMRSTVNLNIHTKDLRTDRYEEQVAYAIEREKGSFTLPKKLNLAKERNLYVSLTSRAWDGPVALFYQGVTTKYLPVAVPENPTWGPARQSGRTTRNSNQLDVEFQDLRAFYSARGADVELQYQIADHSWKQLKKEGIGVTLKVLEKERKGMKEIHRSSIKNARGSLLIRAKKGRNSLSEIAISLEGRNKKVSIEEVSFDGERGEWIEIAVFDNVRSYERAREQVSRTERAGDRLRVGDSDRSSTRKDIRDHGRESDEERNQRISESIRLCGKVAIASSVKTACQDSASMIPFSQLEPVILACGAWARSASSWAACGNLASQWDREAASAIKACADAAIGENSTRECVANSAGLSDNPTQIVRACQKAMIGSSNIIACVQSAQTLGRGAASVIGACESSSIGSAKILACMKSAASMR